MRERNARKERDGKPLAGQGTSRTLGTARNIQRPETSLRIQSSQNPKIHLDLHPKSQNPPRPTSKIPKTKIRDGASTIPDLIPSSSVRLLIRAVKDLCAMLKSLCNKDPFSLYLKNPTETPPAYFCEPKVRWEICAAFPAPEQGWGGMDGPHAGGSNETLYLREPPLRPNQVPKVNRHKTAAREQLR